MLLGPLIWRQVSVGRHAVRAATERTLCGPAGRVIAGHPSESAGGGVRAVVPHAAEPKAGDATTCGGSRLADPPAAAAVASSPGPGYCEPAARACRCRAFLIPPRAAAAPFVHYAKRGTARKHIYTYPSKKALAAIIGKVRALTRGSRHRTLADLLRQANAVLRGWCNYFRYGVSKATFHYVDMFTWRRITLWLRKRHKGINWKTLYRRFLTAKWDTPSEGNVELFRPQTVEVTRYRWRGYHIPAPWASTAHLPHSSQRPEGLSAGLAISPSRGAGAGITAGCEPGRAWGRLWG